MECCSSACPFLPIIQTVARRNVNLLVCNTSHSQSQIMLIRRPGDIQTASTLTNTFELILDAYSQIGEHMPLLEQYKSLFGTNSSMTRVLVFIYSDILKFHKKAVRMLRGKCMYCVNRSTNAIANIMQLMFGNKCFVPSGRTLKRNSKEYFMISPYTDS